MPKSFYEADWSLKTGLVYSSVRISLEEWDSWWMKKTYTSYGRISFDEINKFILALQGLVNQGELQGLDFLFQMGDYDCENWILRAHRQCHKEYLTDQEAFPASGIKDSFDRIRALRKARAKAKKE